MEQRNAEQQTKATEGPKPRFQIEVVVDFTKQRCEMCEPPFMDLEVFYEKAVRDEIHGDMKLTICPFHHRKVQEFADSLLDREVLGL